MLRIYFPATVIAVASVFVACREQATSSPPTPAPAPIAKPSPPSSGLVRVAASSLVCMVNDRYMGSDQIPVTIDGKIYYGCCAGCKDKLQNSAAARTATDPVTHAPVDKATAVIAKTETGKVYYFESEQTLARYAARE